MHILPVVCALLIEEQRVLAVQRSTHQTLAGFWEFPGGKIEPGESEQEALIREITEELNLIIHPYRKLAPLDWKHGEQMIRLIPWLARFHSGELQLLEHADHRWLGKDELNSVLWAPADLRIVEQLKPLLSP